MIQSTNQPLYIFVYDIPKHLASSVLLTNIVKEKTGYELTEPVQFKSQRTYGSTSSSSPCVYGVIKVPDTENFKMVAAAIKYFDIEDDRGAERFTWHCRSLPFDRDLVGINRDQTNRKLNCYVKNLPQEMTPAQLDQLFTQAFGDIKSVKISTSFPLKTGE